MIYWSTNSVWLVNGFYLLTSNVLRNICKVLFVGPLCASRLPGDGWRAVELY